MPTTNLRGQRGRLAHIFIYLIFLNSQKPQKAPITCVWIRQEELYELRSPTFSAYPSCKVL